jgi:hypothetical protein
MDYNKAADEIENNFKEDLQKAPPKNPDNQDDE